MEHTLITTVMIPMKTNAVKKQFFNSSISPEPKYIENTTLLPIQNPIMMEVNKTITENELPTAARAWEPMNFPTITVSATLYNC